MVLKNQNDKVILDIVISKMSVFCVISHIDFVTSQNNEFLISQNKNLFYTTEVISKIYFVIKIIMILRYHKFNFVTSKKSLRYY